MYDKMYDKSVSIIIVTRGTKDHLRSCLDSLEEQEPSAFEAIVIDNSLDPELGRRVAREHPEVRLYSSATNLSYCESLNKGIEISRGDFILCLNDDVILDKEFIREASRGFYADKKIGMASGKIVRSDGKTIDSTGLFLSIWRSAGERGYGRKDTGEYDRQEYIFGVSGAAAFYRREMLEEIKIGREYFDEDHRFFYEDLDISWRAQNSGWKAYYTPKAIAYHVRGATARRSRGIGKPHARRYLSDALHLDLIKNRYLTIIKNESLSGFLLHLPTIALYDIVIWGYILLFRPKLIVQFIRRLGIMKSAARKRGILRRRMNIMKIPRERENP